MVFIFEPLCDFGVGNRPTLCKQPTRTRYRFRSARACDTVCTASAANLERPINNKLRISHAYIVIAEKAMCFFIIP